jgi:hypothetical protein
LMIVYGYARVSTKALAKAIVYPCCI